MAYSQRAPDTCAAWPEKPFLPLFPLHISLLTLTAYKHTYTHTLLDILLAIQLDSRI